jgi:PAS domain S-box-containing protein
MLHSVPSSAIDLQAAILRNPLEVEAHTPLLTAIARMSGAQSACTLATDVQPVALSQSMRSSCVVVIDEQRHVLGIVTERDIVRLSAEGQDMATLTVGAVMRSPVTCLRELAFTDLFSAIHLLQQQRIRHLPILNDQDQVVGLVTHESLRTLSRPIDLLRLRQVQEVMTREVVWATAEVSLLAIAQQMTEHRVSSVLVVEAHPATAVESPAVVTSESSTLLRPVGILTERDIVQAQALGVALQTAAVQVMSTPVFSVSPQDSLWSVQILMEQRYIQRLAVTGERGELLGILTQSSLLQALNPLEVYNLAAVLEQRVEQLERDKIELLEARATELERQVNTRTSALRAKMKQDALLTELSTQIRRSLSLQTILETTVEQVRRVLECDRVCIWQFVDDWQTIAVAESTDSPHSLLGERVADTCFKSAIAEMYRQGRVQVVPDIHTANLTDCHRQMLIRIQTRAKILVPLLCGDTLWGLLSATESQVARDWHPEEVDLLRSLSNQLAIALRQATIHEALQEELRKHQETERQLRASEQRYISLLQASPVGIFRYDPAGQCTYINERGCSICDITTTDALGEGWRQCIHPHDQARLTQAWQQALATASPLQIEYRCVHRDGTVVWVYAQTAVERDEQGRVVAHTGTITDISDRKRAEQQLYDLNQSLEQKVAERTVGLMAKEAQIQAMVNAIPDLLLRVTRDGRCLTDGRSQTAGRSSKTHISDWLPPDRLQEQLTAIDRAIATGTLQVYEQQVLKDGQWIHEEVRIMGIGAHEALLIVRDITARMRIEQENQQLKERLEFLLSASPAMIYSCRPEGDYGATFMSSNVRRILGYSPDDFTADSLFWSRHIHPDDAPRVFAELPKLFAQDAHSHEYRFLHRDGHYRWLRDETCLIRDSEGQPVEIIGYFADISDRKQAETLVKRQLAAMEAAIDGVAIVQDDVYIYLNAAHCEMFGYDGPAALLEQNWRQLYSPEELARFEQEVFPVLVRDGAWQGEAIATRQDGTTFIEGLSLTLTEDGLLICVCRDITTQKQNEQALQDSEEKFRQLAEVVDAVFWILDLSRRERVYVSPAYGRIWGRPCTELYVTPDAWMEAVHPDDRDRILAAIPRQMAGTFNEEYRIVRPDGEIRWIRDRAFPICDGQGAVYRIAGIAEDITPRRQIEETIRQQAQRETLLREIMQRIRQSLNLHTIFDTACQEIQQFLQADRVGIFQFDPASNWDDGQFVSEAVVAPYPSVLTVRVHDHCFGDRFALLYQQGRIQAIADVAQAGLDDCHLAILTRFQVRANLILPVLKGESLWGLLCIHQCSGPRQWQQDDIDLTHQIANQLAIAIQQAGLVSQLQQELTERQQAQQQLTERNQQLAISNEELARATRLKDEFLANMSHELRTPLNAILGMTEGLQETVFGPVNESQVKALQTIERSGLHLLELINDVLDLAKIEAGQMELDFTVAAIAPLCQASLTFVRQQALKKRIQLTSTIPSQLPDMRMDERRLRQVLINLLNNAVKFTPEGGQVSLEISSYQAPQDQMPWLRLQVRDTGIGISSENIAKLFQPFIQIDSALNRKYDGTGLGLALVKHIIDLHGGNVGVTSEEGVGSCFWVDLPYSDAGTVALPSQPSTPMPEAIALPTGKQPLILLAEDNPANINTLSSYLRAKGYRVLLAGNGREAIAMAKDQHPDLVLMDIQMPEMDGITAITQIRAETPLAQIPIIALTALAMEGDRDRCLAAGATDYLSKPVRLKQLTSLVQTLLSNTLP